MNRVLNAAKMPYGGEDGTVNPSSKMTEPIKSQHLDLLEGKSLAQIESMLLTNDKPKVYIFFLLRKTKPTCLRDLTEIPFKGDIVEKQIEYPDLKYLQFLIEQNITRVRPFTQEDLFEMRQEVFQE